jgi:tRNA threonylcarbamoyladenosine biosynthesis protein TsaB
MDFGGSSRKHLSLEDSDTFLFMLFLSVETSGRQGSIALVRADAPVADEGNSAATCHILEVVALAGGMFSAHLVPQLAELLARHGFGVRDIDAFIVASGPGSFTGLRVGLAAIKALAEVLQKPIAAVSLLEAVALSSGIQGRAAAVLDAGRGDVYWGEYEISGSTPRMISEQMLAHEEFLLAAKCAKVISSDTALADAAEAAGGKVTTVAPMDAGAIASVGVRKVFAGDTVSPELLEANYIRRADAKVSS